MSKLRLDQLVTDRGLVPSRERARAMILAGQVTVDGQVVSKAGAQVDPAADVAVLAPDHPYVGRGAARVVALDVGHGQLDWRIRNDPRVVVIEHFNARHLTPADIPEAVDIVCIDVSFISLRHIFPVIPAIVRPGADVVALVKPQFEAGRGEVGAGIVRDEAIHARVVDEIRDAGAAVGLTPAGVTPSPITGQKGNIEFLLHLHAS